MTRLIAVILFCAGVFCLGQSHAQVPFTGAGLGKPSSSGSCSFPSMSNLVGRYMANTGVSTSAGIVTAVADQSGHTNNLTVINGTASGVPSIQRVRTTAFLLSISRK